MPVKDIKKAGPGSQRGDGVGECVSQPALFEEEVVGEEEATAVGSAGVGGGRAAVYARVSSDQQEKDETIESQMAAIEAYAREHDVKLIDEDLYTDEEFHLVDSGDVDGFYAILRQSTICCSKNASGQQGDPINLVMVGSGLAIRRALLRAGWNETAANDPETTRSRSHLYRGRRPDGTFHQYRPLGRQRAQGTAPVAGPGKSR